MSNLGLPVPPGFTITTEVCAAFNADGRYPADLESAVGRALADVEKTVGARLGDTEIPLLLSVRSGARASMPGMMDTVLNLGLNDATVEGLARRADDARFAYDSYRRFVQMFGSVVLGVDHERFEDILGAHKDARGLSEDRELGAEDWRELTAAFKDRVYADTGEPFPVDATAQLWAGHRRGLRLVVQPPRHQPIDASTASPNPGAPRSTSRPWCSATWGLNRRPASPSRAIPLPAPPSSSANT